MTCFTFAGAVWGAVVTARHLALLVFGCCVAAAAWPPAGRYAWSAAGRHVSLSFGDRCAVAEAMAEGAGATEGTRTPRAGARGPLPAASFLPAGVVLERPAGGASSVRLTVPAPVSIGVTGLAWLAVLLLRGGGLATVGAGGAGGAGGAVDAAQSLLLALDWRWALRYAAGAGAVAGTWWCVYAMPRDGGGWIYNETQALHIAGAAFGVALATMLITFD